jgi:putative oxidoreductase
VAASVHLDKGLWATSGGSELALVYGVVAAATAVSGPGAVSLDRALAIDDSWSVGLGFAAIVVGLLSGAAVIARARWTLRRGGGADHAAGRPGRPRGRRRLTPSPSSRCAVHRRARPAALKPH